MITYLSAYRTQDKMRGVHYYPSGALCWFETNRYGDPIGAVYYIRKVPDMELIEIPRRQRSFKQVLKKKKLSLKEKFTKEKEGFENWAVKKPRLRQ